MTDDAELPETERRMLAALKREVPAPADVEKRTLAMLRERGLVRSPLKRRLLWAAAAAAIAAAFASGAAVQRAASRESVIGPRFLLLLYGGPTSDAPDRRGEYASWARSIAASGVAIAGEELSDAAEDVPKGSSSAASASVPLPRGYFIVSAANVEEARRIASSCPHLRYGGHIVIRGISGTAARP